MPTGQATRRPPVPAVARSLPAGAKTVKKHVAPHPRGLLTWFERAVKQFSDHYLLVMGSAEESTGKEIRVSVPLRPSSLK